MWQIMKDEDPYATHAGGSYDKMMEDVKEHDLNISG